MFNEKHLSMPDDEKQRIAYHEAQHAYNRTVLNQTGHPEEAYLFVLHPSFKNLHERMKKRFKKHTAEGYPFAKTFPPLPTTLDEATNPSDTYVRYDEVLALLRAYSVSLKQNELGQTPNSQPYEFVEAFIPEDLKLLENDYRAELAKKLLGDDEELRKRIEKMGETVDLGEW